MPALSICHGGRRVMPGREGPDDWPRGRVLLKRVLERGFLLGGDEAVRKAQQAFVKPPLTGAGSKGSEGIVSL